MAKRNKNSPTDEDIERIAESMDNDSIVDIDTFEDRWDDYMEGSALEKRKDIKTQVFDYIAESRPGVERVRRSSRKKEVARKDTSGYDKRGTIRGRIVRAKETTVTIRGKSYTRFRDSRGRFVSRK